MKSLKWICPHCKKPLDTYSKTLRCENNHCFDIAKQGYVNLLPVNQKSSKNPGDDEKMLLARSAFLEGNHFQPLQDAMTQSLRQYFDQQNMKEGFILDCGCGEGHYQRILSAALGSAFHIIGIDIAKKGIKLAAAKTKKSDGIDFAVASSANIPLPDKSCTAVYSIFSPIQPREIHRILKEEACFLRVLPGPHHLYEIKEKIYREAQLHDAPKALEGLSVVVEKSVKFNMHFDMEETYSNLISMTPFAWEAKQRSPEKSLFKAGDRITADFNIQIMKPAPIQK
jgi:23S rRNA (guanine745-N1)-methyltransferase